jgi:hypothetical protein
MSDKRDRESPVSTISDLVPGKDLEKAAAEVASDAGKGLVRGIARTLGAATAEWVAKKEAKADSARKAIETHAEIERAGALQGARRSQELGEVEHQKEMELARRRADRMFREMAHEQENLETISKRSLELIEEGNEDGKSRELDKEWLFRFSQYAERISDKDVQEMWANALRSAATEGQPKLSPTALLQLSLMDRDAANSFESFCRFFKSFGGAYPIYTEQYGDNPLHIDFRVLEELELVASSTSGQYAFADFTIQFGSNVLSQGKFGLLHASYYFTQKGSEIAGAVFSSGGKPLSPLDDEEADNILNGIVSESLRQYRILVLEPKQYERYFVLQLSPNAAEAVPTEIWQSVLDGTELSPRLKRLLSSYRDVGTITVHDKPA